MDKHKRILTREEVVKQWLEKRRIARDVAAMIDGRMFQTINGFDFIEQHIDKEKK